MTPNPQCATPETTIIDALHMMHDGKFLHLPVVDKGKFCLLNCFHNFLCFCAEHIICFADGNPVACVDVLEITHAAISLVNIYLRYI